MTFIPSCDNREDAIRSLSEIYSVSTEEIARVLKTPELQEISEVPPEINTTSFLFVVCHLLNASPGLEITHACYYHSTSYNGCPSWFDDGLLGSSQGAERFLEKIAELIPSDKKDVAETVVKSILKLRSECEGTTAEASGPYAWDTLAAASSNPSAVRYRVPEAIRDLWSPSFYGTGGLVDLSAVIQERLKPVVVKFKGEISHIDNYCISLWAYLLSDDDERHLIHSFRGNGQTISKEDIVALIDVS